MIDLAKAYMLNPFASGALELRENILPETLAQTLMHELLTQDHWNDGQYVVGGRIFHMPREQTWYADPGIKYNFTYHLHRQRDWTPSLLMLKSKIESLTQRNFNSVLINWYRDGEDWVDWHSDHEEELGPNPYIASFSLGTQREFCYREKFSDNGNSINLSHNSLLIMNPDFQRYWEHSIAKDESKKLARLNFTFRSVIMPLV